MLREALGPLATLGPSAVGCPSLGIHTPWRFLGQLRARVPQSPPTLRTRGPASEGSDGRMLHGGRGTQTDFVSCYLAELPLLPWKLACLQVGALQCLPLLLLLVPSPKAHTTPQPTRRGRASAHQWVKGADWVPSVGREPLYSQLE